MDQQNVIEIPEISLQSVLESSQNVYIPSSVEKKRALMMYLFFGIIISIVNKKVNDFEYFHLKQSMGWWMLFILSVLISAIILFIPIIKIVWILWLLLVIWILVFFIKQVWSGKYYTDQTKYIFGIFPSLGYWLITLFDINFEDSTISQIDQPNEKK